MRRRAHQFAYMRPVVPDFCPWPMRFQRCPTLDLAASLAPGSIQAQRPPTEPVSLSPVALTALAGGDAAPRTAMFFRDTMKEDSIRSLPARRHEARGSAQVWPGAMAGHDHAGRAGELPGSAATRPSLAAFWLGREQGAAMTG
jgi:hypothetical protein